MTIKIGKSYRQSDVYGLSLKSHVGKSKDQTLNFSCPVLFSPQISDVRSAWQLCIAVYIDNEGM